MPTSTWTVLADPNRRAMLDVLRQRPTDVTGLMGSLRLTQPSTSKHLKVLRDAGLVTVTPSAQRRIYSVVPQPLEELDAWLAPYRALWNASLDSLGRYLDSTGQSDGTGQSTVPSRFDRIDPAEEFHSSEEEQEI